MVTCSYRVVVMTFVCKKQLIFRKPIKKVFLKKRTTIFNKLFNEKMNGTTIIVSITLEKQSYTFLSGTAGI